MTAQRLAFALQAPAVLLLAGIVGACATSERDTGAPAGARQPDGLAKRVQRAATAEDHAALAAYFEDRAASEERLADGSRDLRERYGRAAALPEVREHYEHLMDNHRRNAADYRALARVHRRQAGKAPAAGSPQDPVGVADAFAAALARGDGPAALALLDPQVLIHESGGAEASRDEYAAHHLGADMAFLAGAQVEVLDRRHGGDGELAWVATRTRTTAKRDGKPAAYFGTESLVLRHEADGWRIVHVHWSSRAAQPKARAGGS